MASEFQKPGLLKVGIFFRPFLVPAKTQALAHTRLLPDEELIIFERNHKVRALRVREMAYHHVAQGELAGRSYLVTF